MVCDFLVERRYDLPIQVFSSERQIVLVYKISHRNTTNTRTKIRRRIFLSLLTHIRSSRAENWFCLRGAYKNIPAVNFNVGS